MKNSSSVVIASTLPLSQIWSFRIHYPISMQIQTEFYSGLPNWMHPPRQSMWQCLRWERLDNRKCYSLLILQLCLTIVIVKQIRLSSVWMPLHKLVWISETAEPTWWLVLLKWKVTTVSSSKCYLSGATYWLTRLNCDGAVWAWLNLRLTFCTIKREIKPDLKELQGLWSGNKRQYEIITIADLYQPRRCHSACLLPCFWQLGDIRAASSNLHGNVFMQFVFNFLKISFVWDRTEGMGNCSIKMFW